MSFDTIAFGTVNSIHYRSSLHSRRDVLYVAFLWVFIEFTMVMQRALETNGQMGEHIEELGQPVYHAIALNLDTHSHSDKQHTAGHKRRLYAIFSNKRTKLNNVFQTIPSDVPFKQWHVVLDPRSSSCGCSKHSCIDIVFAICHSEVPFFPVFKHLIAYFIGFFPHYCHI